MVGEAEKRVRNERGLGEEGAELVNAVLANSSKKPETLHRKVALAVKAVSQHHSDLWGGVMPGTTTAMR